MLTKLALRRGRLDRDEEKLLRMALCNIPSLQTLVLTDSALGSAELAELAPALYHNTSIKVLDMSSNNLNDMESARLLRDIIRLKKSITPLICVGIGLDKRPALLSVLQMGWAAFQRY
jgi:Ran GTPase-activating protein (RanGAP) involved in mRNA processing and transport